MFMKTSVPYSYKFLILARATPGSSIILKESSLTIERFTKEQTICISTAPKMQFGKSSGSLQQRSKKKQTKPKRLSRLKLPDLGPPTDQNGSRRRKNKDKRRTNPKAYGKLRFYYIN